MKRAFRHPSPASRSLEKRNGETILFLSRRNAGECLLGALGIALMCWMGESFYKISGTLAAPLWPSSGLALGLLLLRGWRLFPAISLGTITATTLYGDPHVFSIFGSVANTLESLIGWFLMVRVFGFSTGLSSMRDVVVLMLAGAPWGTLAGAILCTLGLVASGSVQADAIPSSLLFWTGNILGILIFTPLVLRVSLRLEEGTLLSITPRGVLWTLAVLGVLVFGFSLAHTAHTGLIPLAYLTFPLMLWLAHDWKRDVIPLLALVTVLMTVFTVTGHGPLLRDSPFATYAEMTMFISIYSISCLLLMGAVEEREHFLKIAHEHQLESVRNSYELKTLRANLNPHFLFNSLNVIKALVGENPDKAREALLSLGTMLRTSLRVTGEKTIPLREEMQIIRDYLTLQKLRFEERLQADLDIDSACDFIGVPPLIPHQLVENAIKHGIEQLPDGGVLSIKVTPMKEHLLFTVGNPGTLPPHLTDGFGLSGIRSQLLALYGAKASLTLREVNGRIEAILLIPAERPGDRLPPQSILP